MLAISSDANTPTNSTPRASTPTSPSPFALLLLLLLLLFLLLFICSNMFPLDFPRENLVSCESPQMSGHGMAGTLLLLLLNYFY